MGRERSGDRGSGKGKIPRFKLSADLRRRRGWAEVSKANESQRHGHFIEDVERVELGIGRLNR